MVSVELRALEVLNRIQILCSFILCLELNLLHFGDELAYTAFCIVVALLLLLR
jgi:hypothetical protein